jgi:2-polyprenyl-6-methoxyphenol hydroxylase-like FAD-dependent oxidoreductase
MTTATPSLLGQRAVVLGASIAGLLAARVLSERYAEVVLLERDELPDAARPRKGTPQAVHPHGLLARGRRVMEELFPGFTDALIAAGALHGDLQRDIAFEANRQRFAAGVAGITGLAASRLAIEAELRRRLRARPGVRFITGVDVIAPVLEGERITGVRYIEREGEADGRTVVADLTVDPARRAGWPAGVTPRRRKSGSRSACATSARTSGVRGAWISARRCRAQP